MSLDIPCGSDEFIQAAMEWHFNPETGSPFWLKRADSLGFDPRREIRDFDDLARFPNIGDELRSVQVRDLIPKGFGEHPDVLGVYESGGTTGVPKRFVFLREWWDMLIADFIDNQVARNVPRGLSWLSVVPNGPHFVGELARGLAAAMGGILFAVDMDLRWVKQLVADGQAEAAAAYAEHLVDQAANVLMSQDVGGIVCSPPVLERIARREELADAIRQKVRSIVWTGAQMDPDTRYRYRTELFPGAALCGVYGSTTVLGGAPERVGLSDDDPCVFDPLSPYISFEVVDPKTRKAVPYGERGRVVMHHVSRSFLLPNNLERDVATRVDGLTGQSGDSVGDVGPVQRYDGAQVIEGVY